MTYIILGITLAIIAIIFALLFFNKSIKFNDLKNNYDNLIYEKITLETQLNNALEQHDFMQKIKQDIIEQTQLASIKSNEILSQKIYSQHQQYNNAMQETQAKKLQETTQQLSHQFQHVQELVQQFGGRLHNQENTVQTIEKLLSTGQKVGQASETILANTLRAFSLKEEIDFKLQYHMHTDDDAALRPDAVIFLPNNQYLVIDSKASAHFYELARYESDGDHDNVKIYEKRIRDSMHTHLRNLKKKKYREELLFQLIDKKIDDPIVIMAMWLPSEQSIERLHLIDPEFTAQAAHEKIYLASTHSLWGLIGVAAQHIFSAKKNDNQQDIIRETSVLLRQVHVMIDNTEKFGTTLKRTVQHYDKFINHINKKIIPTSKNITQLGIDSGDAPYNNIKHISDDSDEA